MVEKDETLQGFFALAMELKRRGATPNLYLVKLPGGSGPDKVGLDDYLVAHPKASLAKLPRFGVGSPELKYMQEWYKPWRKRKHIPSEEGTTAEPPVDLEALRQAAAPVLEGSDDPLKVMGDTLRDLGYGGDVKPAVVTYLAVTSRLLRMHAGAMPVHLLLLGAPSAGKSYTMKLVLHLFPAPRTT